MILIAQCRLSFIFKNPKCVIIISDKDENPKVENILMHGFFNVHI